MESHGWKIKGEVKSISECQPHEGKVQDTKQEWMKERDPDTHGELNQPGVK